MTLTESNGGKMDFSVFSLSKILAKAGEGNTWSWDTEISKDKGPLFIFGTQRTTYNLMDAGNFLWGNAANRLGGAQNDASSWSLWNDPKDSQADQNAIQNGWFYQEGFQDVRDCPQNR